MKRAIIAIMCLLLTVGVFACSKPAEKPEEPAEEATEEAEEATEEAAEEASGMWDGKVLKVGIEGTYKPYTYHDESDALTGFDVELARALAEKMGVEIEFTEAAWDSLLAGVDAGRLDTVINTVGITDERKEKYDFVGPYLYMPRIVVTKGDNETLKSVDDIPGSKIASSKSSTLGQDFVNMGAELVIIEGIDQAAQTVLSGRADFVSYDVTTFNSYVEEHPEADLKIAFAIPGFSENYGIPVRKGDTELFNALDAAFQELQADGTIAKLSDEFLKGDYTNPVEE